MSNESKKLDLLFFASVRMNEMFWFYARDYQSTSNHDSFDKMVRYEKGLNINARAVCKLIQVMASCKAIPYK